MSKFVVIFIQLDGSHHLFSGNFGVNKTFGNCGRSKDSVSVWKVEGGRGRDWMAQGTHISLGS